MDSEEIARWCGFNSAWEMITTHMSNEELLDLLRDCLEEEDTSGWKLEIVEEIAHNNYDWHDEEKARADADDAAYEAYREAELDRYYDDDDMVGC
jgi:hypothetical protein